MKKVSKFFGLLAIMLAFSMVVVGCGGDDPDDGKDGNGNNNGDSTKTVAKPTATPAGGTYTAAQSVTLNCSTSGAIIRYTTDGTDPTAISTAYTSAINISTTTTLRAIAMKSGMYDSGIFSAEYIIDGGDTDTWSNVTSISQVNGTWKYPPSVVYNQDGITITGLSGDYYITFDATAETMTVTGSQSGTYSGGDIAAKWESIKSNLQNTVTAGGGTITFDDASYSYTATYNNSTLPLPDNFFTLVSYQINQNGTKLKMSGGSGANAYEIIYTKEGGSIVDPPTAKYIITGSGTTFTATKGSETVGTANSAMQTVIDDIQTNANGASIEIQFGDGGVLDTGTAGISFSGAWGVITLSGKITSESSTITIPSSANISINSIADITSNSNSSTHYAIGNSDSTSTVTISSGTISRTGTDTSFSKVAIWNIGKLFITNGATVTATQNVTAVTNYGTGTATISGGTITGSGQAITNSLGTMTITGGTISSTDNLSPAIYNYGTLNINGGTISSGSTTLGTITNGDDDRSTNTTCILTINGGTVRNTATGGYAVYNCTANDGSKGTVTIGTDATITGNRYGVD